MALSAEDASSQAPHLPRPAAVADYDEVDAELFQAIRTKGQPAVLRGLASDWPAVAAARRSDDELITYLRRFPSHHPVPHIVGSPEIEGRFLYTEDLLSLNFKRGMSPLDPFLNWLLQQRANPRPYAVAVQSQDVPSLLPGFERENAITLVRPDVTPRAWIGNRVRVAPHYDLTENVGVVVAGRRRFTLFPPDAIRNLYVGPIELTPAGTPVSLVDLQNPDLERFPKFADALGCAQVTELGLGDAIYIPFYWWHGVDSLETINLFVNYWWNDKPSGVGSPYDALMYAFYAIKVLPPEQRAVWRTVFDHYIFELNGNPAEHLPENARGVLGEINDEVIERMTDYIRLMLSRFEKH
ncbi:MAG TPA: cupin-like domain-containing protein [Sphingomicrobium sp.]|nr:cupin-like domain-containing protein [Sphingomicrobium sp.]